jgi:hypothetical protein
MLTLFSIPKPFVGQIGEIQETAIASWAQLAPDMQVVLVGDEAGVAGAAAAAGATHVDDVERNEHGTPRVDDAFARVAECAEHPLWCFVNADIVLLDDFIPAVTASAATGPRFLMVGQNRDLAIVDRGDLSARCAREELRARAVREGISRGTAALDFFVFRAGLFDPIPPFLVGRACFDNWLVWKARQQGPVIDSTAAVVAIHQRHDYAHLVGGLDEAYYGEEAAWNRTLAGGRKHLYTLHDASHKMRADGSVVRNFGATLRVRETIRRSRSKLGLLAGFRARDTR